MVESQQNTGTQVQSPQGGFEGRYKQDHKEGSGDGVPPVKEIKPEERPPAGKPPYSTTVVELLQAIVEQLKLKDMTENISTKKEERYYNTPQIAIQVATPNPIAGQTLDPTQVTNGVLPGYQVEGIYTQLGRIAPQISVINDGNATIYVITTPDGTNWSTESPILVGEARRFYNIWELRIRSTVAGTVSTLQGGIYRVTEYEYSLAYTSTVLFNRTAFIANSVVLPDALNHALDATLNAANVGATLPFSVPNGFTLVIRANIKNVGTCYVSASDATNAVLRTTLNPGDIVRLFISSSSLAFVALTNFATDRVDILVEQ